MLERVKEMLKENTLCVLCTANEGNPYCSLMTYVLSEDLRNVYMVTTRDSRKYKNLLANASVSLLLDNRQRLAFPSEEQVASVTFGGVHKILDPLETEAVRSYLVDRHRELKDILCSPDCIIFGIELKSFLLLSGPVESVHGEL